MHYHLYLGFFLNGIDMMVEHFSENTFALHACRIFKPNVRYDCDSCMANNLYYLILITTECNFYRLGMTHSSKQYVLCMQLHVGLTN